MQRTILKLENVLNPNFIVGILLKMVKTHRYISRTSGLNQYIPVQKSEISFVKYEKKRYALFRCFYTKIVIIFFFFEVDASHLCIGDALLRNLSHRKLYRFNIKTEP